MTNPQLTVAMIGAGYAARLHGDAFRKVTGTAIRLKTVVDPLPERALHVQSLYGYEQVAEHISAALEDPEIDVIDICTPPVWHKEMIVQSLQAGKHVICEKPLLGYFGLPGDPEPIGTAVSKAKMYEQVMADMAELRALVRQSGKLFGYAENYIYASAVQRAAEIIAKKKSKILFMKGEESLKGSQSLAAGEWREIGGGALIRAGVHPLSSLLMLKQYEAKARGEEIGLTSVVADMGMATLCLDAHEHRHIKAHPHDVEDYASLSLTFTDGTKAQVNASDLLLGGTKGFIEVYCNDNVLYGKISPVDVVKSYFLDEENLEEVELSEMLPSKLGWNNPFVADETIRGFLGELQDFTECIATGREPIGSFELACQTMQVVYGAYLSAAEGRRVDF